MGAHFVGWTDLCFEGSFGAALEGIGVHLEGIGHDFRDCDRVVSIQRRVKGTIAMTYFPRQQLCSACSWSS